MAVPIADETITDTQLELELRNFISKSAHRYNVDVDELRVSIRRRPWAMPCDAPPKTNVKQIYTLMRRHAPPNGILSTTLEQLGKETYGFTEQKWRGAKAKLKRAGLLVVVGLKRNTRNRLCEVYQLPINISADRLTFVNRYRRVDRCTARSKPITLPPTSNNNAA